MEPADLQRIVACRILGLDPNAFRAHQRAFPFCLATIQSSFHYHRSPLPVFASTPDSIAFHSLESLIFSLALSHSAMQAKAYPLNFWYRHLMIFLNLYLVHAVCLKTAESKQTAIIAA